MRSAPSFRSFFRVILEIVPLRTCLVDPSLLVSTSIRGRAWEEYRNDCRLDVNAAARPWSRDRMRKEVNYSRAAYEAFVTVSLVSS